jgi:hypothetical protein
MDILHILRSKPDAATEKIITALTSDGGADVIRLYRGEIDWESVVEAIFGHNRVICWW